MDEENKDNLVRVSIYGQEYTVKAQADPSYIKSVASFVNEKMEEVERSLSNSQSDLRIAILALMNITDEYFNCKRDREALVDKVNEKAKFLIDIIDEEIKG